MKEKWISISEKKKKVYYIGIYLLSFGIIFSAAFFAFWKMGKTFIWSSDGLRQHYPVLVYLSDYFKEIIQNFLHGNFRIPMFDFSIGAGDDIISTFSNYGLGDPLMLISIFFPRGKMELCYQVLIVLRMALAGLSFSLFACYRKKNYSHVLAGALIYVFCGFVFWSVRHTFFITPMIYLPLLLWATDKVIMGEKKRWLIVASAISLSSGFYYFYMMSIVVLVYALLRFFSVYGRDGKMLRKVTGKALLAYFLGVLIAAVSWLPAILGYLNSTRVIIDKVNPGNLMHYPMWYYRNVISKFITAPGSMDYGCFAAVVVLAGAVLFVQKNKKYLALKVGVVLCALCLVVPFGGYMMNAFGYVTNRWAFILAFVMAYTVAAMLPYLFRMGKKEIVAASVVLLGYGGYVFFLEGQWDLYQQCGLAALTMMFLYFLFVRKRLKKRWVEPVFLILLSLNLMLNGVLNFDEKLGNGTKTYMEAGATDAIYEAQIAAESTGGFNRTDSEQTGGVPNAPTIQDTNGYSVYYSVINHALLEFQLLLENGPGVMQGHRITSMDGRAAMEALSSVRYYVTGNEKNVPYGFEPTLQKNVYENKNAMPLGFTYDSYVQENKVSNYNGLEKQELMMSALLTEQTLDGFIEEIPESSLTKLDFTVENRKHVRINDERIKVLKDGGTLTLSFDGLPNSETYIRLENLKLQKCRDLNVLMHFSTEDGVTKDQYFCTDNYELYFGRKNIAVNLGYAKEARKSVTITFDRAGIYRFSNLEMYCQSMDHFENLIESRKTEALEAAEIESNRIAGRIKTTKEKLLCLTIPYSSGWSAKVDGERVEPVRANIMYMALPLSEGTHEIELTYRTPGLIPGMILSGIGILFCVLALIWKRRKGDIG